MSAGKTECPVCGKQFNVAIITEHVNSCLNDEQPSSAQSKERKQSSGWSFLTKRRLEQENPTNSGKKAKVSNPHESNSNKNSRIGPGKVVTSNKTGTMLAARVKKKADDGQKRNFVNSEENSSDVEFVCCEELSSDSCNGENDNSKDDDMINEKMVLSTKNNSKSVIPKLFFQAGSSLQQSGANADKSFKSKKTEVNNKPLAERVRPSKIEDYVGQTSVLGQKSLLHSVLEQGDQIPSMILWGPPGCGKTTLAKIVAQKCREKTSTKFLLMSATSASVKDVKDAAKVAHNDLRMLRRKTILFLDEVHRFNKLQQDALLPHVEDGTITLIGATTENPSFHVNSALLSRCRLVTLEKLQMEDIKRILKRALTQLKVKEIAESDVREEVTGEREDKVSDEDEHTDNTDSSHLAVIESSAIDVLAGLSDGDARTALNGLQLAVEGRLAGSHDHSGERIVITAADIREGLQRCHILYDRTGEEHYNTVSALIKSMRGSDDNAALYWLARMLEGGENPLFIVRRLVVFASEDVGLADPSALTQAVSTYQACHFIGMPECAVNLAQCVVYLSRAPKSVEVYMALNSARDSVKNGPLPPVPLHLRNSTNPTMKALGYGKNYKYPPNFPGDDTQEYFPPELKGTNFFKFKT